MKIIAVDFGRSSTKVAHFDKNFEKRFKFSSIHGIVDFDLARMPVLNFDRNRHYIVSINGSSKIAIGEVVNLLFPPDRIIYATNDEMYIEYAINYILLSIAIVLNDGKNSDEIMLPINLTYNNIGFSDQIKNRLRGVQRVVFYNTKNKVLKSVEFSLSKITILQQGWSSLLYMTINSNLTDNPEYQRDGLVIDIGRRTVDVVLSRKLTPVKGISYDLGCESIFVYIRDRIFERYNIRKSTEEIEELILLDDVIMARGGETISPREYLDEAVRRVGENIKNMILENFGIYTPNFVILTGGGSIYFRNLFEEIYSKNQLRVIEGEEAIFSNAIGMARFIKYSMS